MGKRFKGQKSRKVKSKQQVENGQKVKKIKGLKDKISKDKTRYDKK